MEAFYFAFGDVDSYMFGELPDNEAASAVALTVNQSGSAKVRTVALLTPEQLDTAAGRSLDHRPPGS